jgi:hypothetical protein
MSVVLDTLNGPWQHADGGRVMHKRASVSRLVGIGISIGISCVVLSGVLMSTGWAQQFIQTLVVPPDKFDAFCYFNSGVYSVGAIFCTKSGTSISCKAPEKKGEPAIWERVSQDAACQAGTALPAR